MESTFINIGKASSFPEGKGRRIKVGEEDVALWHVRGKFYAIDNICAHQHFALLHQGILEDLAVTCPMHGWTFSLETGRATVGSGKVRTYAVKVEGKDVYVEVSTENNPGRQ
jgi:NAD(P)H-dependent nitrite reductase small subunit